MPLYEEASAPLAQRSMAETSAPVASTNPFNIPADEEIFRFREEERTRREHAKAVAATTSVAEKGTFASQMQATATADTRTLLRELRPPKGLNAPGTLAASSIGALDRRKENENMADFIAK
jgi:hypothetical protein